jgi:hypothetical protein
MFITTAYCKQMESAGTGHFEDPPNYTAFLGAAKLLLKIKTTSWSS